MLFAAGRPRITIARLMFATLVLSVLIRGLIEAPRIARESISRREAAAYARRANEMSRKGLEHAAMEYRQRCEEMTEIARRSRPDPIGLACYATILFMIPILSIAILIMNIRRLGGRPGAAPLPAG
jgi:hypothetical protein